ncbi:MAG: AraC family transcriptional regulator [Paenibacillaceae bacterium]|nr:AraC family transcriptional regulator [Paenibacillaceae bacterium]
MVSGLEVRDREKAAKDGDSLADRWFKLTDVEQLLAAQLSWPKDRDFIVSDTHVLIVSATGDGHLVVDGRFVALRPGTTVVCTPGQLIEPGLSSLAKGLYVLRFKVAAPDARDSPVDADEREAQSTPGLAGKRELPPSIVVPLCEAMRERWLQRTASARLRCEAGLLELLGMALDNPEHRTEQAIDEVKAMLDRQYRDEMTVEQLAETAGLSRFHFMRLFKLKFGKGVTEYITELRLADAKRLMTEQANLSLRDIAFQVGYKNETYFSRLFKKQTGMAPAIYVKNSRIKVAAYSWVNIGQLLALQTIPYAAPMDHYWTDYYRSKFGRDVAVPLSHQYEFNREALRKAQPDYIVAIDLLIDEQEQMRLRAIAPTLFLPWAADWREHLRMTASFLSRTDAAESWLREYEQKAAETREAVRRIVKDDTVLIVNVFRDQLLLWGRRAGTALYDDLRLATPEGVAGFDWTRPATAGQLADFQADRVLMNVSADSASMSTWRKLLRSEEWGQMPAVRQQRVHATFGYDGLEAPWNNYSAYPFGRFMQDAPQLFAEGGLEGNKAMTEEFGYEARRVGS